MHPSGLPLCKPIGASIVLLSAFFSNSPNPSQKLTAKPNLSALRFGFAVSFCEGLGEFEKKADSRTMEAPIGLQRGRPDGCIAHQTAQENEVIK